MFKILTLIGIIFTGNIFCAAMESGGSSLEEGIDDARQSLTTSQISAETPATKLQYFKIFWETARATYNAYSANDGEKVANQKVFLQQNFEEMQRTLGAMPSLTLQSMDTQMESFTAYRYYKNAYNAEKKPLRGIAEPAI
ncbi:MAG: hypothetical protein WCJ92_00840 [Alphaproteobacteria bacterium]